jgi:hypothetical protein
MPLAQLCEEIVPASTGWQRLATRPVQAVTWVEGFPRRARGSRSRSADYAIDLDADGGARFRLVRRASGPRGGALHRGLAAGWADLPESLRHGVLRLAAHHYRQRESDSRRRCRRRRSPRCGGRGGGCASHDLGAADRRGRGFARGSARRRGGSARPGRGADTRRSAGSARWRLGAAAVAAWSRRSLEETELRAALIAWLRSDAVLANLLNAR